MACAFARAFCVVAESDILPAHHSYACNILKGDIMAAKNIRIACKSIFKNGCSMSKSIFTQKWIQVINKLEKMKGMNGIKS